MARTNFKIYSLVTNFSLLPKHASSGHGTTFKKNKKRKVTYNSITTQSALKHAARWLLLCTHLQPILDYFHGITGKPYLAVKGHCFPTVSCPMALGNHGFTSCLSGAS